jgi:hypothetical protein
MAENLPISGLPTASALDGSELLPFVQGGVTTQATAQDILDANLPVTSSGITVSGDIVPTTPQGATLGTADKPFAELYLQSGSISIESDTPGDPSAIISNVSGNLEISVGGMLLTEPGNSFIAETGSFQYISGSLTQLGDYIRIGDTITTGSVNFSGSFEASLQEDYVWVGDSNNRSIETPISSLSTYLTGSLVKSAYGSFYDTTTQSGSANTAYAIKHNTTDLSSDVSIVSDTRITMAEAGVYTIISTQQFKHTSGGTVYITGWIRKNGVDVANSATDLTLKGNGATELYAINYFVEAAAGDYFELIWSATDSSTEIVYQAARTSPTRPAVPSVITTVNRVG